uniref:ribonuclease H n=1 Tax=Parastrongyloides trichosuri TaxID=131310 RepID=A0A0N5A652_PARTI
MYLPRLFHTSLTLRKNITKIYIDGSFRQHPKGSNIAGIGIYWGDDDPRNLSLTLPGEHTNNTAEINAAIYALRQAKEHNIQGPYIYSDSNYVVKSINEWIYKWKSNGWQTTGNKDVKNKELFEELDDLVFQTNAKFIHVKGHDKENYENSQAHDLAFKASENS